MAIGSIEDIEEKKLLREALTEIKYKIRGVADGLETDNFIYFYREIASWAECQAQTRAFIAGYETLDDED